MHANGAVGWCGATIGHMARPELRAEAKQAVATLLRFIGEDPQREGLLETPRRVVAALEEMTEGYGVESPEGILKTFEDGAAGYDEAVMVRSPFTSMCEHHMLSFFGTAFVAYIPNGRIVGLSKLTRLVHAYARRLQVQERLTEQVADAIEKRLQPKGVAVLLRARHLCMEARGVKSHDSETVTCAVRGVYLTKPEAREEFMLSCQRQSA